MIMAFPLLFAFASQGAPQPEGEGACVGLGNGGDHLLARAAGTALRRGAPVPASRADSVTTATLL